MGRNALAARDPSEVVEVDLADDEWGLLVSGLNEWGGPARLTDAMARGMGFLDRADFFHEQRRLILRVKAHRAMSRSDWSRALLAMEIVWASDLLGSGVEWPTTTGYDDHETLDRLRHMQRALWRAGALCVVAIDG